MENVSRKNAWAILIVIFIANVIGSMDKSAINIAVVPIATEFGFDKTQIGLIMSIFFTGYAITCFFGGIFADKFGSRNTLFTIMIVWSLFTGFTGVAWSLASFVAIRLVFGLAEGAYPATNTVTIAELFPVQDRGKAKSVLTSSTAVGMAIGSIVIAGLCTTFGWRIGFWIFAISGILVGFVFFYVSRSMKPKAGDAQVQSVKKVPFMEIMKIPLVWKLTAIQFLLSFFQGVTMWMPTYWVKEKGLKLTTAGFASSLPMFIGIFATLLLGYLLDKYWAGKEKWVLAVALAIGSVFLYCTYATSDVMLGIVFITLCGVFFLLSPTINYITILKYLRKDGMGTAAGIMIGGGQIGGMVAPTMIGYILTKTGSYSGVFMFSLVCAILATIVATTLNTGKAYMVKDQAPAVKV